MSNIERIYSIHYGTVLLHRGGHVHTCPECYEHVPCEDACSCEPGRALEDGTPRGAFATCDRCAAVLAAVEVLRG